MDVLLSKTRVVGVNLRKESRRIINSLCAKHHPGHCGEFHVRSVQVPTHCVNWLGTRADDVCDARTSVVEIIAALLNEADTVGKASPTRSTARRVGLIWEAGGIIWRD
jgi:hypothetical protein